MSLQRGRLATYKDLEQILYKEFGLFLVWEEQTIKMDVSVGYEHLGGRVLPIEVPIGTPNKSYYTILLVTYEKITNYRGEALRDSEASVPVQPKQNHHEDVAFTVIQ